MAREILFKAKRLDNGEWIEGYPHLDGKDWIMWLVGKGIGEPIDPNTICQYTGLTDKNGNKIWENDVVEISKEDGYVKIEWQEDITSFVMVSDSLTVSFNNYWNYEVEVYGNSFDNPELLEGGGLNG